MFGRKYKKEHRKRSNPLFGIFRLLLSLIIFAVLVGGVYSAYKQFSGADPLNLSPQSISSNLISKDRLIDLTLSLLSIDIKGKIIPADQPESSKKSIKSKTSFKFAIVADCHNDNNNLAKALSQAKAGDAKFVIGLGDFSDVGTKAELIDAKKKFDEAGLRYFLTPGDHDLWESRDKNEPPLTNFYSVFGSSFQAFGYGEVRFIILYNSDNYKGLGEEQLKWFKFEMENIKQANPKLVLAFVHEPLYHPSSDHYMGKVTPSLLPEAKQLIKDLKQAGTKEVFAGDIHYFTQYSEPETVLHMTTIGAITSGRNVESPRFGLVTVYEDGSYLVEDVEIK